MSTTHTSTLIIGSGAAGYTAAIYSARAMLNPILLTGLQKGGQLTLTNEIENFPGFPHPVDGNWLMDQMFQQAQNVGANILDEIVTKVDLNVRPFKIFTDSDKIFTCDSLIIATGAKARWLGIDGEQTFIGGGVSACATCDGFFYRNQNVVVVGGGNTAVEEALYLSDIAKHVTLIHRRDKLRAEQILQDRLFKKSNISILWNQKVIQILGTHTKMLPPQVSSIRLQNILDHNITELDTSGVFIAIGFDPCTNLFDNQLKKTQDNYLWVEAGTTKTSIPGVFAAGDVADSVYHQAILAAGHGCMAALDAKKYLEELN
ncbi:thioredoxin-disulfide reductase [Bartonella sp. DGB1]|uniref:thioredoxin-disulfide reductase n=1 Tax=Bartonella sp. DGB1 TaxID=3239807 RepID=UPI003523F081